MSRNSKDRQIARNMHLHTVTHTHTLPPIYTNSFEEWRSNLICLSQCVRTIIVNVMWKCIESCRLVEFGLASFLTCILFDSMQMGSLHTKKNYIYGKTVRTYVHIQSVLCILYIILHTEYWVHRMHIQYTHRIAHTFRSQTNIPKCFYHAHFNVISSISCLSCVNYIRTMFRFGCVFSHFDEITLYLAE